MTTVSNTAEWRFLPADAEAVGVREPLPEAARITLPGGDVSALEFTPAPGTAGSAAMSDTTPVVFLHGAALNAHTFDSVALLLGRHTLSLDLPGHGSSEWLQDADYSPQNLAAVIGPTLRGTAFQPAHLVGQSLGGLTAAMLAAAAPDTVRSLTLIDIVPDTLCSTASAGIVEFLTGQREFQSITEMVDRAIAFGFGENRESLERGVTLNSVKTADGKYRWSHHFGQLDSLVTGAEPPRVQAAQVWEALEQIATAHIPTHLIYASHGMLDTADVDAWRTRLPGSTVTRLGGGHNLQETSPAELTAALRRLL